mmetsp:Transcript_6086/g.9852  ORF Transcript_6086/g.9852 Transcript_6086/m.9852 type:complete len:744 (+) Transcript_6086:50-2281(+)
MWLLRALASNGAFLVVHSLLLRDRGNTSHEMQIIAFDCGILHGPPNSLLAAHRVLEAGATALNVDLALTRDEKLVAAHSSTHWLHLQGLPAIEYDLSSIDFGKAPRTPPCTVFRDYFTSIGVAAEDLIDLHDCEPQPLSTAADFLSAFPGVPLHFDLKADSLEKQSRQAQLLDAELRERFPERLQAVDAPITSVRFFEDPKKLVSAKDFSLIQQLTLNLSVAVFLGDPADELGPLPGTKETRNNGAKFGLLHALERGPRGVPRGIRGVYLPSKVMAQGWTVPSSWGQKLFLICDAAAEGTPTLEKRMSQKQICLQAGASGIHTAFLRGLVPPKQNALQVNANSPSRVRFLRNRHPSSDEWSMEFRGGPADSGPLSKVIGRTWKGRRSWARCVTKQVTAMLVLRLIEMGKLRGLDVPILELVKLSSDVLSTSKQHVLQRLTLRQVMAGVGGFQSISEHPDWEVSSGESVANLSAHALSQVDTLNLLLKDTFTYSNQAWVVVERAIEVAVGLPLPDAARKYLFNDLGLSTDTYYSDDGGKTCPEYRGETQRQRNLRAAIGLCTTLDDLILISETLVEDPGIRVAGVSPLTHRQVLSPQSVQELLVDQLAVHFPQAIPHALKAHPIKYFIDHGFPVVGRSLGAYILEDNIVMAHGGDNIYVGTKIYIRKQSRHVGSPTLVQIAFVDHQYNDKNDFMAHVPETLLEMSKCYALLFGAAAPWHQAALRSPGYEPPCAKYENKKVEAVL